MKKLFSSVFAILFFLGCGGGGGGSSSSSSGATPEILISNNSVMISVGETKSIRTKILNMPDNNSSIETNIDNTNPFIVDFITDVVSNKNEKSVNLLVYGANPGESIINLVANSVNQKVLKSIGIRVLPVDNDADVANGNIDINNISSGITSISKIFPFDDGNVLAELDLQTPSECGENTFINDSSFVNFEKDDKKLLINLNLFRYNTQGDREFSKFIKTINVIREEQRENNETVVIPDKAKEIVGMEFALTGVDINYFYNLEVETDMCKAEFKLKLSDLLLDSDADGVNDDIDRCPNTPLGSVVDEFGCSIDIDSDGVEDDNDLCPNTPIGTLVNEDGCSDRDGDGIADVEDACPDNFGTIENGGCPDSDDDGIIDKNDVCPLVAGDGTDGCPLPTPTPTNGDDVTPTPTNGDDVTPTPTQTPTSNNGGVTPTPIPTSPISTPRPDNDADACTTNDGFSVAKHTMGESSFSNGLIYFRTLTPYTLSLYYRAPINRDVERTIDLNSFQLPDTDYKFFLEISSVLATGEAFYVKGQGGNCYKGHFPNINDLDNGTFPNKNLTLVKK